MNYSRYCLIGLLFISFTSQSQWMLSLDASSADYDRRSWQLNLGVVKFIGNTPITLGVYVGIDDYRELNDIGQVTIRQNHAFLELGILRSLGIWDVFLGVSPIFSMDEIKVNKRKRGGFNYGYRISFRLGRRWKHSGWYLYFARNGFNHHYLLSENSLSYSHIGVSYMRFFNSSNRGRDRSKLCPTYW